MTIITVKISKLNPDVDQSIIGNHDLYFDPRVPYFLLSNVAKLACANELEFKLYDYEIHAFAGIYELTDTVSTDRLDEYLADCCLL